MFAARAPQAAHLLRRAPPPRERHALDLIVWKNHERAKWLRWAAAAAAAKQAGAAAALAAARGLGLRSPPITGRPPPAARPLAVGGGSAGRRAW